MHRGWVKLWRCSLDSAVMQSTTPGLLKVWIWCLLRAGRRKRVVSVRTGRGTTEVELQPGQFIFGRNSAVVMNGGVTGIFPDSLRRRMQKLREMGNISLKSATHYTVVTICNWEVYQGEPGDDTQPTAEPPAQASAQPTANQPPTNRHPTKKEEKEERTKEEKEERKEQECKEQEKKARARAKRFTPPTLEEVTAYCRERGKGINPQKWFDHYTANGWKVGPNAMKDWKAAVRTWENNELRAGKAQPPQRPSRRYHE